MASNLQEFLDCFSALGGIADNICQKEGETGRGLYPIDSSRTSKIMTPSNLLVNARNYSLENGEIVIKANTSNSSEEIDFLERYYNECSWGNNGNSDSAAFLQFICSLPESIRNKLIKNQFIGDDILEYSQNEDHLLKRFIRERFVKFKGENVLAPVWEFVNHSSFAHPLRIAPYGVETPLIEPSSNEILFKYSAMNSSMRVWRNYGFACSCIFAYSVPFNIKQYGQSLAVRCHGKQKLNSKGEGSFFVEGDTLFIDSLLVGCSSPDLPLENFKSILSCVGLSSNSAHELFSEIHEVNAMVRRDLVNDIIGMKLSVKSELHKALDYEIQMIQNSSIS